MLQTKTVEPGTFSILKELMEVPALSGFSLVGGTALSLVYGHRVSVDLDLFSNKPFENIKVVQILKDFFKGRFTIEEKQPKGEIQQPEPYDYGSPGSYLFFRCSRRRSTQKPDFALLPLSSHFLP
jgi:hypothetical protein